MINENLTANLIPSPEWIFFQGNIRDLQKIQNFIGLEITVEYEIKLNSRETNYMPISQTIQETTLVGHCGIYGMNISPTTKVIKYRRIYDPKSTEPKKIISSRSDLFQIEESVTLTEYQQEIKNILETNFICQETLHDYVTNNYSILRTEEESFDKVFAKYDFSFYEYDNDESDFENEQGYRTVIYEQGYRTIIYKFVVKENLDPPNLDNEVYIKSTFYASSRDDNRYNPFEFVIKSEEIVWKFEEIK